MVRYIRNLTCGLRGPKQTEAINDKTSNRLNVTLFCFFHFFVPGYCQLIGMCGIGIMLLMSTFNPLFTEIWETLQLVVSVKYKDNEK